MKARSVAPAIAFIMVMPAVSSAQVLSGHVLEAGSGRPVPAALVRVSAAEQQPLDAQSDSLGFFQFELPQAGRYEVRVERLGYAPGIVDTVSVRSGEIVEVTIRLSVAAVPLAPLLIVERRRDLRTEFERRLESGRRSGLGVFLTREDLESTTALSVTSVVARVPLMGMDSSGLVSLSGTATDHQGRPCRPTLYLNGARMANESIDAQFLPTDLEGIEIYRNRTELPSNFAGIGHCAAILFWSRQGEPSRGGAWRFLVGGGALAALAVWFLAN